MEDVGIFYGHLVNLRPFGKFLRTFGIFVGYLFYI
jgi:hypothetical protein